MTPLYYSGRSRPSDKGGGGGGAVNHTQHEIRWGAGLKKNSFSALRASAWSKNKVGRATRAGPSPGSATVLLQVAGTRPLDFLCVTRKAVMSFTK